MSAGRDADSELTLLLLEQEKTIHKLIQRGLHLWVQMPVPGVVLATFRWQETGRPCAESGIGMSLREALDQAISKVRGKLGDNR